MKKNQILTLLMIFPLVLFSQKFTLNGYISDISSGEELLGASIYETGNYKGTTSNTYGFYSITLPKGEYTFVFSYIGYKSVTKKIILDKNIDLNISLEKTIEIDEVVVVKNKSKEAEKVHETSKVSTINIPIKQIESLPNIGGEVDILKAIQLLPGVQSGSEGSSGLYVRGGGPDQNLILLDGVPVYNASHLFGFISVFNSNAISNVELIKGGFPARFGGRLSSVVDIKMKEGNKKEFHGDITIGLLASRLTLEGPIIKDKTSFIVSARRTYMDLLMRPASAAAFKRQGIKGSSGYAFTDINAKINHKFSDKDRIFWSFYYGDDDFDIKTAQELEHQGNKLSSSNKVGIKYGNITSAIRYNHKFNPKLFLNTTATFSRYSFNIFNTQKEQMVSTDTTQNYNSEVDFKYKSGVRDWSLKLDFDYLAHPNHYIKYGINGIYHTFTPGVNTYKIVQENSKIDTTIGASLINTGEIAAYIEDDLKIGSKIKINIGGRASIYYVGTKKYWSVEPRFAANYKFLPAWSMKTSFAMMTQYLHLLTNSGIGLPTDLWVPPTEDIKPQRSWQATFAIAHTLLKKYEFSVEGYYKQMDGLITYKEGSSFFDGNGDWENKIVSGGKGESYGAEFFAHKKTGKFTGWLGYTLSWTTRQFENVNNGEKYSYKYDRRHDISVALMYKLGPKIDFSGVWVYGTGNAVTVPESTFVGTNGVILNDYGVKNATRMPAYHRLDLGINFHKKMKRGKIIWNVSVYNVYNRKNPFYVYLGYKKESFYTNSLEKSYKQVSLFPILPSVSFRRKF